jgi:hypothetical protein
MIKSYVITIHEIDVPEDAVELVREKLTGIELMKNSFGIISAHPDAVYSGVFKAICDELPFEICGISCDDQCSGSLTSPGEIGTDMFSIMILTGDDCSFACGHTNGDLIGEKYSQLKKKVGESGEVKLALLYTPFTAERFPGEYIDVISSLEPGLPIFGSVSHAKETVELKSGILTLCNGEASGEEVVLALISGDFTPKFFVSNFTESATVLKNIGTVTKCEKNILMEIDGVNAGDFLDNVGFSKVKSTIDDTNQGLLTTAFVLKYGDCGETDGVQVVSRSPLAFVENGVHCVGHIHNGARVSVAFSTPEAVMETAHEMIRAIADSEAGTALIYSCIGRRVGLLSNSLEELNAIKEGLAGKVNHTVTYVGGEISPTFVSEESVCNHEHNQTLIACVF